MKFNPTPKMSKFSLLLFFTLYLITVTESRPQRFRLDPTTSSDENRIIFPDQLQLENRIALPPSERGRLPSGNVNSEALIMGDDNHDRNHEEQRIQFKEPLAILKPAKFEKFDKFDKSSSNQNVLSWNDSREEGQIKNSNADSLGFRKNNRFSSQKVKGVIGCGDIGFRHRFSNSGSGRFTKCPITSKG